MENRKLTKIFNEGSRTFFTSSLFFPKEKRIDITALYAFTRVADDFVDGQPQDREGFLDFKSRYYKQMENQDSNNPVIQNFVELQKKYSFEQNWVDAFLDAMESDLNKDEYCKLEEVEKYMYGSAEVVGLMMAKILELPEDAYIHARFLGKAFQYINFIRDIKEDLSLKRVYIPCDFIKKYGFNDLELETVNKNPENFEQLIREQINLYRTWQEKGQNGFKYIKKRYLVPIKTASDIFLWTAKRIEKDPFIIYREKVKPSKLRIRLAALNNIIKL